MKQQNEQLIKDLGGSACGCKQWAPVLIGDGLERLEVATWGVSIYDTINMPSKGELVGLWAWCRTKEDGKNKKTGLTKSLQEIYDSAEWVEVRNLCLKHGTSRVTFEGCTCKAKKSKPLITVPKQPHIKELFQFLIQLGL